LEDKLAAKRADGGLLIRGAPPPLDPPARSGGGTTMPGWRERETARKAALAAQGGESGSEREDTVPPPAKKKYQPSPPGKAVESSTALIREPELDLKLNPSPFLESQSPSTSVPEDSAQTIAPGRIDFNANIIPSGYLPAENKLFTGSVQDTTSQRDMRGDREGIHGVEVRNSEGTFTDPLLPTSSHTSYSTFEDEGTGSYNPLTSTLHTTLLDELRLEDWDRLNDRWNLELLVSDIRYIGPENIRTSYEDDCRWHDVLKASIENWTGTTWDWWPLKAPRSRQTARVFWSGVNTSPFYQPSI
jgi:hypothetical protein